MLLYTRKAILEKQGFAVSTVEPLNAVERLNASSQDVVIACHSLTPEEANSLVRSTRAISHRPALISFTKELSPVSTPYPFDASIWSLATPEAFISKVHEVLSLRQ